MVDNRLKSKRPLKPSAAILPRRAGTSYTAASHRGDAPPVLLARQPHGKSGCLWDLGSHCRLRCLDHCCRPTLWRTRRVDFTPASRSRIASPAADRLPLLELATNNYGDEPEGGG